MAACLAALHTNKRKTWAAMGDGFTPVAACWGGEMQQQCTGLHATQNSKDSMNWGQQQQRQPLAWP